MLAEDCMFNKDLESKYDSYGYHNFFRMGLFIKKKKIMFEQKKIVATEAVVVTYLYFLLVRNCECHESLQAMKLCSTLAFSLAIS